MAKDKSLLEELAVNLDSIQDEKIKETIQALFNLIKGQTTTVDKKNPVYLFSRKPDVL